MLKWCVVILVQCALFALGVAVPPKSLAAADSRLQSDTVAGQSANKLQEATDDGQNTLSKLLGDYDKVKALSEGSDCRCQCVVRPLSRSACRRIEEGSATAQDSYTVETITSGPECKCACVAPPSAVNPCEGELRLKKLRESAKDDVKLATILELLEGSYYGMDLLKLHSVISNLVDRVTHIEKVMALKQTKDEVKSHTNPPKPTDNTKRWPTAPHSPHQDDQEGEKLEWPEASQQATKKDGEKFFARTQSNDSTQVTKVKSHVAPKKGGNKELSQGSKTALNGMIIRGVTFYKSEPEPMATDDGEHEENDFEYHGFSGDGPIDLLIEENLLQHRVRPRPKERAGSRSFRPVTTALFHGSKKTRQPTTPTKNLSEEIQDIDSPSIFIAEEIDTNTTSIVTFKPYTTSENLTTMNSAPQSVASDISQRTLKTDPSPDVTTNEMIVATQGGDKASSTQTITRETLSPEMSEQKQITGAPNSTEEDVTTGTGTSSSHTTNTLTAKATQVAPTTPQDTEPIFLPVPSTKMPLHTSLPVTTPATTSTPATTTTTKTTTTTTISNRAPTVKRKYKISWEEEEEDLEFDDIMQRQEGATTRKPEECKDTLATISEPVTHNKYGRTEGAWMKDPKSDKDRIYVTNFYYGNKLLEFQNMEVFKKGRFTNSYKLPYNWIGTGHVVYNGAFYYNRAFSRDIIKFDLRQRYVAAWTMLHDAVMEEATAAWEWRSHSDIDIALDESGLWIIYPAMDDEGFLQEVVILSRLNPVDLSMQRETTWRTGLRRNHYGNCFIVCGVLYAVDSYNQKDANLEYAFDTHTNTQMIPRMPFTNNYTYTTQIDYNPKESVLYAWDNGHQVTYDIKFAYVDSN
ncbi:olfactomedin-like 2Ba isoform X1 [Phycodurus eques]|uniref:olfactomedin-like 2Ba isoform X1 n=1 Tax=Phycodurus eques TaxID=693459 RepID=UPI002ACE67EC|nr:olfactomedin-like 2Ba isoform X1 [Phycodurus eques]